MKSKSTIGLAFSLVVVGLLSAYILSPAPSIPIKYSPTLSNVLNYHSLVTIEVNGKVISSHSNFFSSAGQDIVLALLTQTQPAGGTATVGNVTQILLCNDTNSAGCVQTYYDSGLTNATGTVTRIGPGNWSIKNTFTSTVNNKDVNATALFNGTVTAATYFAGNNFTKVTLQNGDQLTVTWNISVS